jgi:prepilin signal peptidase PulO-like enzyme (type II secretory pathway)
MILMAGLVILGLSLGSFINALVWRLFKQEKTQSKKPKPNYSILTGRSMCPHCKHVLRPLDLIPVLSWAMLRGQCRYCSKPIHWQYPLVEMISAALLLTSYIFWPFEWSGEGWFRFIIWAIMLTVLIALLVYDLRWMLLPDRLTYVFFGLAVVQILAVAFWFDGGFDSVTGPLLAVLPLGGLFYLLFQISDGKWIGGGDVKLGFGLGLLAGTVPLALLMLFLASFIGTIVSGILMLKGKASRKTLVPFGPFLIIAAITVQIFGNSILDWYSGKFL